MISKPRRLKPSALFHPEHIMYTLCEPEPDPSSSGSCCHRSLHSSWKTARIRTRPEPELNSFPSHSRSAMQLACCACLDLPCFLLLLCGYSCFSSFSCFFALVLLFCFSFAFQCFPLISPAFLASFVFVLVFLALLLLFFTFLVLVFPV